MQSCNGIDGHFKFCPRCGDSALRILHDRELTCDQCDFTFFINVAAAAGAFILREDALVLCVRGKEPGAGKLDVPGGFLEFDETLEDGLRREIREELGIEVDELSYLASAPNDYRFRGVPYKTSDVFFRTTTSKDSHLMPKDDVAEFRLFDPFEVDPSEFAFKSTRYGYLKFLESLKQG